MKFIFAIIIFTFLFITPVKSNTTEDVLPQLATCMAVIDFQINFYQMYNQLHAPQSDTPHILPALTRALAMKHHVRTRIIPNLTPDQMQLLATIYVMVREQVFNNFAAAVDSAEINHFVNNVQQVDRSCDPLNSGTDQ